MKISEDNYRNFYFGNSNECYIQSEFYSHGFEAMKMTPDIGYDLIVTNCARRRFLKEEPKQLNIQVKSTVCRKEEKSNIYISDEDFKLLLSDSNSYLISIFCEPIFEPSSPELHVSQDTVPGVIDSTIRNHILSEWDEEAYVNFKWLQEYEKSISCEGFFRQYIWFNNSQLQRLIRLEAINECKIEGQTCWKITFKKNDSRFCLMDCDDNEVIDNNGLSQPYIARELMSIWYMFDEEIKDNIFYGDVYY